MPETGPQTMARPASSPWASSWVCSAGSRVRVTWADVHDDRAGGSFDLGANTTRESSCATSRRARSMG
jgi:hypothetical protein